MAYSKLARRLKFLIASWHRHGAAHVVEVFRQERIRRAYARSPQPLPTRQELMEFFPSYRGDAAMFLEDFHTVVSRHLPLSRANRKEFYLNLLLSLEPYDDILTDAEMMGEGKFPALGICINEPDLVFDWHRDYSSGVDWPKVPFHTIRFLSGDGSDVKYPWELSRMYWIAWLGKGYWTTNNGAWTRDFVKLIDSWTEENPIDVGVNWAMPMEVAIRGFWLVMGYGFFRGAPTISDDWWLDYLRLLWGHGRYLMGNLEYFSNLTNHYVSNCFGLLAVGTFFSGSNEGDRWFTEGRRRLIEELEHQVLSDGVHYERSIGYHRLVLEIYLIALVLAERGSAPFPEEARRKIEQMAEFLRDYIPPVGTAPQLGDSDDGIIMRLRHDQEIYDHRDTLSLAAGIFRRDDFNSVAGRYSQAALLMLGSEGFELMRGLRNGTSPGSRLYRDGGFAILRSQRLHILADVGEIGLHGNNDTLSFTLSGPGGAYLIDPGTYCYTRDPNIRDTLRSTAAHNTPSIDGVEIAEFDGLWRIRRDRTDVKIIEWNQSGGLTLLEAEHGAYRDLPTGGVTVRRRWELEGDELRIRDVIDGTGTHEVRVRFTVPSERHVVQTSAKSVEISGPDGDRLQFECSSPLEVVEGWHSPSYGVAAKGWFIQIAEHSAAPAEFHYICRLFSHS